MVELNGIILSVMSASLRSQSLLPLFLLSCLNKLLIAKQSTFYDKENTSCPTGQQEPSHVQRVVLEAGEVGSWPQVLGSFVAHDKLDPEDCSVQGLHRLIT